jgi:hypothetical protein
MLLLRKTNLKNLLMAKAFIKILLLLVIFFFFFKKRRYRKSGYYGTNFDFDARLRCYRVLENIAIKGRLVNLDLNFIFFLHCLYIFLQYTTFLYKKPQIFGFQILRVIWDNCVFGRINRFWWRIFNLLYLTIIFKKYVSIWDH